MQKRGGHRSFEFGYELRHTVVESRGVVLEASRLLHGGAVVTTVYL